MTDVAVELLHPGGQDVAEMAGRIAGFLRDARREVLLAAYDVRLSRPGHVIGDTLRALHRRGVSVRVVDHDDRGWTRAAPLIPRPAAPPEYIDSLGLDVRPVVSVTGLMHHKYAVVDRERVWTGSLNWTDDSFTLQENCVARVRSGAVAAAYVANFEELWARRCVEGTGKPPPTWADIVGPRGGMRARVWFCPNHGAALAHAIADRITMARRQVLVCSPVLTSAPILRALDDVVRAGRVPVHGVVDGTQMREVQEQWARRAAPSWKLAVFRHVAQAARLGRKWSVPWGPGRPHDYMHAKAVVCDDVAFVGSFNHSRSGEENAENVLELADAALAEAVAEEIEAIRARYQAAERVPAGAAAP